jgi:hypothetical protein
VKLTTNFHPNSCLESQNPAGRVLPPSTLRSDAAEPQQKHQFITEEPNLLGCDGT